MKVLHGILSIHNDQFLNQLSFISYFNLQTLDIKECHHISFNKLPKLDIKSLTVTNCKISNIHGIESFNKLQILNINNNQINNIQPLAELVDLIELYADNNCICDIYPLKQLKKLQSISLLNNKITDTYPLSEIPLSLLYLSNNQISDISTMIKLNVQELKISRFDKEYNYALNTIMMMGNIDDVNEGVNEILANYEDVLISDISPLRKMTNLTILELGGNNIRNIRALSDLKNLTDLHLLFNIIDDIYPLKSLTKLRSLDLSFNRITSIYPLQYLKTLDRLWLQNNYIIDISQIKTVGFLDASHNMIKYSSFYQLGEQINAPSCKLLLKTKIDIIYSQTESKSNLNINQKRLKTNCCQTKQRTNSLLSQITTFFIHFLQQTAFLLERQNDETNQ
ncbi:Chain_A [Hexamita inflata]|uniref:Rab Family Protein n=1 Tax=Hexamita inflata TaxID=28002 RepID=A0AA86QB37_9EUKA|nr:Chain A [Hexamita inflata]CAI9949669.1 Chain A [Hexamita inflata]